MLVRGVDEVGARAHVVPPPGSFTAAKLPLYEWVLAAQAVTLADGLGSTADMYRQDKETAHV